MPASILAELGTENRVFSPDDFVSLPHKNHPVAPRADVFFGTLMDMVHFVFGAVAACFIVHAAHERFRIQGPRLARILLRLTHDGP